MIISQPGAHSALTKAVRDGVLVRPDRCELCGSARKPISAHHYKGYAKRYWLTVQWLCRACHGKAHTGVKFPYPLEQARIKLDPDKDAALIEFIYRGAKENFRQLHQQVLMMLHVAMEVETRARQ